MMLNKPYEIPMANKRINEASVNDTEVYGGEAEHVKCLWSQIPNSSK